MSEDLRLAAAPPRTGGAAAAGQMTGRAAPAGPPEALRVEDSNLTRSQYLLWMGQRLHPDAPLYNMVLAFELGGAIDPFHFGAAWQALTQRSDALRTVIQDVEGSPRQRVRPALHHGVEHVDLSGADDPDSLLRAWVAERSRRTFELAERLVDTALIRLAPDRHVWYLNQHHLVTDAWSTALVYRQLADLYRLSLEGRLQEAAPLPQYADYVEYERTFRRSALFSRILEHWERKLEEPLAPIRLYGKRTTHTGSRTERVTRELGADRSIRLRELAAVAGAASLTRHTSLFNLFATALFAYLHRVSGELRLAIGTPSHNRASAAFKETIGVFIEVFPFATELTEQETFRSLLAKVQAETGLFLRYAQPGASTPQANRCFNVLLNYIHASFPEFAGLPMRSEWVHAGHGDSRHHLRLQIHDFDASGRFLLHFDFNRDLFDAAGRQAAASQFLRVLDALVADPDRRIREVDLLSSAERRRVLLEHAAAPATEPSAADGTVVQMFEAQAARTPSAVALACGQRHMTYSELDRRATSLAQELRGRGIAPETRVGLYAERSPEAVVGALAVLKAGGAYVPVSPADPPGRAGFVLHDAEVRVLLAPSVLADRLPAYTGTLVCLDGDGGDGQGAPLNALAPPRPGDAAYVLYTSGSTGQPKGVVVEHDGLARYLAWARDFYLQGKALDFPLFTSLSFDLTITSLFVPLISGGRVVIYPDTDPAAATLLRVLDDDLVDVIKLTPSHLSLLRGLELRTSRLEKLIVGGEELKTEQARSALAVFPRVAVYNEYGPTEATVACMIHRFDPQRDVDGSVPIGRAAAGAHVYVLDEGLNPVPAGVVGEIFVSGAGVARGYLNRPRLTAERFLADPFRPGARMYRTGDLGRWRGDGVMQYLGRNDHQLKIRGARVEPAEVEAALLEHPAVTACAVDAMRFSGRAGNEVAYCSRCGLPSSYPGASYDAEGICQLCRAFEGYREKVRGYFRTTDDLRELFAEARGRRTGQYDCLMFLSGGKDSTYALYRLVQMGLEVLAFTLDNGYISSEAKANIRRVTDALRVDHVFGTTPAMNAIFVDSLRRHSNVCNGCFKTLYTLGTRLALERGIPIIVTGLSRGQFFETRLTEELFRTDAIDADGIDRIVLEARKAYHRVDDAVAQLLDAREFQDDAVFEQVRFVDFYRYCDVGLDEMLAFLAEHAPWIRPQDTGRSTNCLINDVGIFVHKKERGYHNYAFPYSWDVRIGHKTRDAALDELNDGIELHRVQRILSEIGYPEALRDEDPEAARLTAYFLSTGPLTAAELRAHLAARLPSYMLPSHFVRLEELPLTPHGKLDRAALPSPEARRPELAAAYVAPRGLVEERVAAIWAEVLEVARVGAQDEFLDLGGNSLLAIQIISRVNQAFAVDLPLQSAFVASTVAALARLVEATLLREIEALSDDEVERRVDLRSAAGTPQAGAALPRPGGAGVRERPLPHPKP